MRAHQHLYILANETLLSHEIYHFDILLPASASMVSFLQCVLADLLGFRGCRIYKREGNELVGIKLVQPRSEFPNDCIYIYIYSVYGIKMLPVILVT